ncbi:MAG: molybdopterin molybdotransferase MoeA [Gemmatimonadaceae bacterium]|nr:molybdopterin molybdotransferase MoeA [Gemmatimonadaceae bacterium]
MQTVAEASRSVLANIRRLEVVEVDLAACVGQVLARGIAARTSMPPWDNSSMDGYAVRSTDVTGATSGTPVRLKVTGDIPAGAFAPHALASGEAMQIMTGAPIPDGADCVVRLEDTDRGMTTVSITAAAAAGKNIRYAGEDFKKGDVVLHADTPIHPPHIGVLASLGVSSVPVFRAPRVAIISSGDELTDLSGYDEVTAGKKIVSSNNYTLAALIREAGAIPIDLGIASDSIESLREKLEQAKDCDLIITSAGVSVGEKDFTREAVDQLGGKHIFWKVRMRPGAPLAFGTVHGKPWLGVSGNPVSAMVSFILFAKPAIRKMMGHSLLFHAMRTARAEELIETPAPLTHFLRGIVAGGTSESTVRLSGSQSSGVMTALARANALIVVPGDVQRIPAGGTVQCIPINGDSMMSETFGL